MSSLQSVPLQTWWYSNAELPSLHPLCVNMCTLVCVCVMYEVLPFLPGEDSGCCDVVPYSVIKTTHIEHLCVLVYVFLVYQ